MPFDSQGKFYRLHNWEQDRIDDIDIVSDHHDEEDDNFAQGLNECVLRNGLVPMEANLNLGGFRINNLGKATSVNDAINKQQLEEAKSDIADKLNQTLCVGDIKCSALQKDHKNWLLCDGREVEREEYNELFEAIGTAFGEGNKVTTFNLPDCRGVVVRGLDNGRGLDTNRTLGSYQQDGAPNISGKFAGGAAEYSSSLTGAFSSSATTGKYDGGLDAGKNFSIVNFSANKSNSIYGRSSEIRMKNIALNYFIKAKED